MSEGTRGRRKGKRMIAVSNIETHCICVQRWHSTGSYWIIRSKGKEIREGNTGVNLIKVRCF
jgi:hypothetical protein